MCVLIVSMLLEYVAYMQVLGLGDNTMAQYYRQSRDNDGRNLLS